MHNPLLPDLEWLLREHPAGLSEYQLLKALEDHASLCTFDAGEPLGLFRRHFLVMNGLYQLQRRLWHEAGLILTISPLHIRLATPGAAAGTEPAADADGALRAYYLDERNFGIAAAEVESMLADFWRRLGAGESRLDALQVLELEDDASLAEITRRYRALAAQHHPDRGGDAVQFVRIRQAYELLLAARSGT